MCQAAADVSATFELKIPVAPTCPQAKHPAQFELSDQTPPPAGITAAAKVVCDRKGAAANPSTYSCEPGPQVKTKTSGQLKSLATVCDGTVKADIVGAAAPPAAAAAKPGDTDTSEPASSLPYLPSAEWQKALHEVGVPIAGKRVGNYYDRWRDVAVLFFDATGESFYPMLDIIDEDDDIYVVVADYESRVRGADVAVQGCNRPPIEPRVYKQIPEGTEGTKTKASEPVRFIVRAIGKCAGADTGGPQLVISNDGKQRVQTIPVNPLYRFAVGVAAAYDDTDQREFRLHTLPGETVPRVAQNKDAIGLSSLLYISFYPSARDFRKTDPFLAQRLQLFVGLDPRQFEKHLVLGVGYELAMGFNALVGWRVLTRQPVLAEGSGLSPGATFDGDSRDLPTRERWEVGGVFVGVGLSSSLLSRLK